ncbi:MAG: hypothetical protein LUE23_08950 [Lachnospiraceae bacterium]|nr:hypothetical protein [Lachnospiraceae bacterium]
MKDQKMYSVATCEKDESHNTYAEDTAKNMNDGLKQEEKYVYSEQAELHFTGKAPRKTEIVITDELMEKLYEAALDVIVRDLMTGEAVQGVWTDGESVYFDDLCVSDEEAERHRGMYPVFGETGETYWYSTILDGINAKIRECDMDETYETDGYCYSDWWDLVLEIANQNFKEEIKELLEYNIRKMNERIVAGEDYLWIPYY